MPQLAIAGGEPLRQRQYPRWPRAGSRERELLMEVLESGNWDSRHGEFVRRFEERFAGYQGGREAICVGSGEAAIRVILQALDLEPGSEVLIPAYTFVATATAVIQARLVPHFVDIHRRGLGMDPRAAAAAVGSRTAAILPVHVGGVPAEMGALRELADRHSLALVEDAAQAWGSKLRGKGMGTIGDGGAFSFHASKNLAAGEGGAVITSDNELAGRCRSIVDNGRGGPDQRYRHVRLGGNSRMTDFQGALLCAAMERYPEEHRLRHANALAARSALANVPGVECQTLPNGTDTCSWHLLIVRVDTQAFASASKAAIVDALVAEGIPASVGYEAPAYAQPMFDDTRRAPHRRGECVVAELVCASEAIWIRHNALLGEADDALDIARAFEKIQRNARELVPASPF